MKRPAISHIIAKTVNVIMRSLETGSAGIDNDCCYRDKTEMLLVDAKKVTEKINKPL